MTVVSTRDQDLEGQRAALQRRKALAKAQAALNEGR
jgi:hypothetical protein